MPSIQDFMPAIERMLAAMDAIKEKHGSSKGYQSEMDCPACLLGRLSYSSAPSNGHIRARCSTKGCVVIIQ